MRVGDRDTRHPDWVLEERLAQIESHLAMRRLAIANADMEHGGRQYFAGDYLAVSADDANRLPVRVVRAFVPSDADFIHAHNEAAASERKRKAFLAEEEERRRQFWTSQGPTPAALAVAREIASAHVDAEDAKEQLEIQKLQRAGKYDEAGEIMQRRYARAAAPK